MECSKIINSIGLLCDIAGAIIIFKFGLPPAIEKNRTGHIDIIDGSGFNTNRQNEIDEDNKYKKWNKIGLILLILGFVLQLVSNFIK